MARGLVRHLNSDLPSRDSSLSIRVLRVYEACCNGRRFTDKSRQAIPLLSHWEETLVESLLLMAGNSYRSGLTCHPHSFFSPTGKELFPCHHFPGSLLHPDLTEEGYMLPVRNCGVSLGLRRPGIRLQRCLGGVIPQIRCGSI